VKLPRDLSGRELIKARERLGYMVSRQTGSHIRLTHGSTDQHHITIPDHTPLRVGTLAAILAEVAAHLKISRDQLIEKLTK